MKKVSCANVNLHNECQNKRADHMKLKNTQRNNQIPFVSLHESDRIESGLSVVTAALHAHRDVRNGWKQTLLRTQPRSKKAEVKERKKYPAVRYSMKEDAQVSHRQM